MIHVNFIKLSVRTLIRNRDMKKKKETKNEKKVNVTIKLKNDCPAFFLFSFSISRPVNRGILLQRAPLIKFAKLQNT